MPIFSSIYRKKFTWQVDENGVPVAQAFDLAGHVWTACCPLCGAWHELRGQVKDGQIVTPRCLLREFAGQPHMNGATVNCTRLYQEWCSKHPGALDQRQIVVKLLRTSDEQPSPVIVDQAAPAAPAKKPRTRKKAAA